MIPLIFKSQRTLHDVLFVYLYMKVNAWCLIFSCGATLYTVVSVCVWVYLSQIFLLSKRPSSYCLIHFKVAQGQLGDSSGAARRQKTPFDGRCPLMENDLRWKTTFDGRRPLTEDDL